MWKWSRREVVKDVDICDWRSLKFSLTFGMDRRCRLIFGAALGVTCVLVIFYGFYSCSGVDGLNCRLSSSTSLSPDIRKGTVVQNPSFSARRLETSITDEEDISFKDEDLYREYDLDLDQEDVIVFVHIQKTGGTTFGRHLVKNLDVEPPCTCYRGRKKCDCYTREKKIWLFSRFSTGWVCGVHADWTELTTCIDSVMDNKLEKVHRKRKYHFITLLRQPVNRFISEWKHVQRGATWKGARLVCNGRKATLKEVPFCYSGEDWRDVTLDEFMECPHNLAINRQTRMLANLSQVNCYNHTAFTDTKYRELLLESAKDNLKNMAFVGLLEYQNYTQSLFEHTFNLNFIEDFEQYDKTHTGKAMNKITSQQIKKIQFLNDLDIHLYKYAKELFFQRMYKMVQEKGNMSKKELEKLEQTEEDDVEYYDYDDEESEESKDYEGKEPVAIETSQNDESKSAGNVKEKR